MSLKGFKNLNKHSGPVSEASNKNGSADRMFFVAEYNNN